MEADFFSGYATRANVRCSDGRTILPGAFDDSVGKKIPLVWNHRRQEMDQVIGHAILEHRSDGYYGKYYLNDTPMGKLAREQIKHGDINSLSIFATNLVEQGTALRNVVKGKIREVSLVLSGANPDAYIDHVSFSHSEEGETLDEAIIYLGGELTHSNSTKEDAVEEDDSLTVAEVLETLTEDQKTAVAFVLTEAAKGNITHSEELDEFEEEFEHADDDTINIGDVLDSMTTEQRLVTAYLVDQAAEKFQHSDKSLEEETQAGLEEPPAHQEDAPSTPDSLTHNEEGLSMPKRNVFDQTDDAPTGATLTHSQFDAILADAQKVGSFKDSFLEHAATYGFDDIDVLFPDAKTLSSAPELLARRQEWVSELLNGVKHSPFSRVKTIVADITADEARAKGYVKASLKKEEIVKLLKRTTTPKTIYKKQKLDRDDIVDITDMDVVAWLKGEMRIMLDEELARAILIGDGREIDDPDKIDEEKIRPIASDNDMYAHQVTVQPNLTPEARVEAVIRSRVHYRGTGTPMFFTTDSNIIDMLLAKDKIGRRLYSNEAELAQAMRVQKIVAVEVMEDEPEILGVLVSLSDYTVGADKGGKISMFDDFDIDYNQEKYLIETRVSGALTKPKSAVVLRRAIGQVVIPAVPLFGEEEGEITIPTVAGVVYRIAGEIVSGVVAVSETTTVDAEEASGYSFPNNTVTSWTFVLAP